PGHGQAPRQPFWPWYRNDVSGRRECNRIFLQSAWTSLLYSRTGPKLRSSHSRRPRGWSRGVGHLSAEPNETPRSHCPPADRPRPSSQNIAQSGSTAETFTRCAHRPHEPEAYRPSMTYAYVSPMARRLSFIVGVNSSPSGNHS